MTYARKQLPKYCHHKSTDRAFVRIEGKTYYLGKHGTAASRREYDRVIAEFIANGRQGFRDPDEILVEQLIIRFIDSAEAERNYSADRMAKIARILSHLDSLYPARYGSTLRTSTKPNTVERPDCWRLGQRLN